jgi:hypothetical protein
MDHTVNGQRNLDASTSDRTASLVKYVTEEGNPKNRLGVTEVEVLLPAHWKH